MGCGTVWIAVIQPTHSPPIADYHPILLEGPLLFCYPSEATDEGQQ